MSLLRCTNCRIEGDIMTLDLSRYGCQYCTLRVVRLLRSTIVENNAKAGAEAASLRSEISKSQRELAFLRIPFEDEKGDRISDGDVMFKVKDGKTLFAHKFLLAGKSAVFNKMFTTEMLEKKTGIIEIDDATFPVMRVVIKFCYDAEMNFDYETVTPEDVLEVAHKYGIKLLFEICEEHLIETIDKDNLPRRLKLAKKFGAEKLQAKGLKYLQEHFDEVIIGVLALLL